MAVTKATINLMNMESIPDSATAYILGGHNYIGKRVIRELSDRGIIILSVDTSSGNDFTGQSSEKKASGGQYRPKGQSRTRHGDNRQSEGGWLSPVSCRGSEG